MSTVYQPSDTLVGPIIHQLALVVASQIGGVGRIYELPPDGPPEHNSVQFPYSIEVRDDTCGKLRVVITFDIHHVFRRKKFSEDFTEAQTYILPWAYALSSWGNQTLSGLAIGVFPGKINTKQFITSQQPFVAVVSRVVVHTEINIPLS